MPEVTELYGAKTKQNDGVSPGRMHVINFGKSCQSVYRLAQGIRCSCRSLFNPVALSHYRSGSSVPTSDAIEGGSTTEAGLRRIAHGK